MSGNTLEAFRCAFIVFHLENKLSLAAIISDKPGHHDFEILKKLVLPDGSVLRAKYPGRPSRDCLFSDPVMDGRR